jgi:hypothetical protein
LLQHAARFHSVHQLNPIEFSFNPEDSMAVPIATIPINIGIDEKSRGAIAEGLSHLLADTYSCT